MTDLIKISPFLQDAIGFMILEDEAEKMGLSPRQAHIKKKYNQPKLSVVLLCGKTPLEFDRYTNSSVKKRIGHQH